MTWGRPLRAFAIGGVVGYGVENVLYGPRQSAIAGPLPFMPVWGAGAAAVTAVAPKLKSAHVPWWGRLASYAVAGAVVEYVAYGAEKAAGLPPLWGYGPEHDLPVDLEHALSWGVLGMVVDALS